MENIPRSRLRHEKKAIDALYAQCPPRAAVVCFDEWGPLELKPVGGRAWAPVGRPQRMRATYRRLHGVEHFLGFYDVHADVLGGVFSPRKRIVDLLPAFARLRRCYPRRRLFVVLDTLHNVHAHPRFRRGLRRLRIRPLFVPTDASWLNLIEAQFGVLRHLTLAGTDDRTHDERQDRVYRCLRLPHRERRNARHPLTRLHLLRQYGTTGSIRNVVELRVRAVDTRVNASGVRAAYERSRS